MNMWSFTLALVVAIAQAFASHPPPLSAKSSAAHDSPAKAMILTKLLEPLEKKEANRSRFSRAAMPPQARRIRILDEAPRTDAQGRSFVAFAIDETRFGAPAGEEIPESSWFKDAIKGCVYPQIGEVLIQRGETYYASAMLLGEAPPTAPAEVCRSR